MVKTHSGRAVVHSEGSYGRAAKKEITRQRLKRKLESTILRQVEEGDMNTTPRRQTRDQIWEMEELFTTPPSVLAQVTIIPPDNTTEHFLRGRIPSWSDFGIAHQFLIRGHDSKCWVSDVVVVWWVWYRRVAQELETGVERIIEMDDALIWHWRT